MWQVSPAPSEEAQPVTKQKQASPVSSEILIFPKTKQRPPNQIYMSNLPILKLTPPFYLTPCKAMSSCFTTFDIREDFFSYCLIICNPLTIE